MQCSLQNLFRASVFLALLLSPERLTAQEPQGVQSPAAATEQPPAVPDLADLIPLATALSDRLANLQKAIADQGELSRLEQQLGELGARVHEDVQQFLALKTSMGPRAGQLAELKAEIESAGDTLTEVSKAVTVKVRTFGNVRKVWLADQKQWDAWQAALRKEEPLEEITTTLTKAQGVIATALGLLQQRLKPLLALQEQVGTLQTRLTTLTAEVEDLLSFSQGGVLVNASPAMLSAPYFSQLAAALRTGVQTPA
jgi:DNA repair exonuclease SbcCD ATPase subunit